MKLAFELWQRATSGPLKKASKPPGTKESSARHRHGFMGGDVREQREQWVGAPPKPPAFFARSLQDRCENESQLC